MLKFNVDTSILYFLSIDGDAAVRAYDGAGCATRAAVCIYLFHITISTTVNHLVCQLNDVEGTCDDTERTAFAALCIDDDSSFHFCHSVLFLVWL